MKNQYNMVKDFRSLFVNEPEPDKPTTLNYKQRLDRYRMLNSECYEYLQASTLVDQVDALIDLMYFAFDTLVIMGVEPTEAFEIIHKRNMDKVGPEGPIIDDTGKLQKRDGWYGPEKELAELFNV